jgi:Family of unknown function (DUF6785)/Domain of unknown function (DUF6784)
VSSSIGETALTPEPGQAVPARRRAVSARSVALGLLGVLFICGLTAYNDYVVANTFMVGNFLPIGLLLFLLVSILLVNGPLCRFAPRLALSRGELSVALCMMLVSCAMPSSGLMRYLPAHLVGIWNKAGSNGDYVNVLKQANLPDWLFPTFERTTVEGRANDPVVQQYIQRVPVEEDTFLAHVMAVPWSKWAVPALTWGLFVGMLVGAMLCLSVVFRRQWVENERLPYPLAGVYLSIIEEPRPGKMLNTLFQSLWFWVAAGAVFAIHGINALNKYSPRIFPEIPIGFAFWGILGDAPFKYTDWGFKAATLYFCMVGIVYFLQSNVALSLWLSFVAVQVARMFYGTYQADLTGGMQQDQNLGSVLVFGATILYIGRHQLLLVGRQMFRRPRPAEAQGRYLPYFIAGWGLILCVAGMIAWLMCAGVTLPAAAMAIGMAGLLYLVIARVVAETGLMFVQVNVPLFRPWALLAQSMPQGMAIKTSIKSFFFNSWLAGIFVHDQRESLSGFMPQALRVADGGAYEEERNWHKVIPFTICLLGALLVGYLVAGASMLYTEYNYGTTMDRKQASPMLNSYGVSDSVTGQILDPTKDYINQGGPIENHSRWLYVSIGAGITATLSILRLRFAAWPLHPVGYLLVFAYPMQKIWFSIFVGWLAKVLIVKYGGASMYRSVKPLFMGLIIGEVGAAAFWLVISLMLNAAGYQYNAINLLPT